MKTGKTLSQLANELDRQSKVKRDFIAPVAELSLEEIWDDSIPGIPLRPLALKVNGHGQFPCTDTAHSQISAYTGVPLKYYERMKSEAPQLLTANVNHWFEKQKKESRMIRTLDGKARALLSNRFRPLDNYDLAEVTLPELTKAGCRIESCEVTETRMYIKAVTERLSYEVKKGDIVQAGIVVSNSEVGLGSLSVEPLLYRLVCTNGLIVNDAKMRKTHVGRGNDMFEGAVEFFQDATRQADDRAFWMKVRDTVSAAFSTLSFEKFVERFRESQGEIITQDPVKVIEMSQKQFIWSDTEKNSVLKHLLMGGELTKFGLANAVTRAAQDVESYDRATEFERLGGTIIELPKNDWRKLAEAA